MTKLLLLGAGHAHLHLMKRLQEEKLDVDVTLVSPSEYQYYSGMFSGYLEGLYHEEEIRIHIPSLTKASGINYINGAAISIDAKSKVVLTEKGDILSYDILSIDIGSLTAGIEIPGARKHALRIKPNYRIEEVANKLWNANEPVVIGGGAGGVEMALALTAKRKYEGKKPVTLISHSTILEKATEKAQMKVKNILQNKGLTVITKEKVSNITSNLLITSGGKDIEYDQVLWLTGPKAPEMFRTSKLPIDHAGYLLVDDTLQVKEYPAIFAAGDCASIKQYPELPKAGVIAVRQAAILWGNIKAFMNETSGYRFKPNSTYLSILSTGQKKGLLLYGNIQVHHHLSWLLKDRIDKKFIERYKQTTSF
ncbi:NAD(P)/FAD-dependent oxidoreductase [Guptibacillus spartinae]|uniref:NAD(P)/FAD-dependent oxidoreductase n=1 Tax=Guptibacillus spartinae TaxID=3025679 RepID=UPI0023629DFB|nr:FAD-dependent oxidoreductase [Pseudalkalibacillus spartinae]